MDTPFVRYDRAMLDAACRQLGLRLLVLFGSRARGKPAPSADSDLDLATLGCPQERFFECYRILAEVFPDHALDLVELGGADPLLRYEIMRNGVLLFGAPDLFFEYRAYAFRDFVDSADLRALEDALFRKKMAHIRRELYGTN